MPRKRIRVGRIQGMLISFYHFLGFDVMYVTAVCPIRPHPKFLFRAREWARDEIGQAYLDSAPPQSGWRARCGASDAGEAGRRVIRCSDPNWFKWSLNLCMHHGKQFMTGRLSYTITTWLIKQTLCLLVWLCSLLLRLSACYQTRQIRNMFRVLSWCLLTPPWCPLLCCGFFAFHPLFELVIFFSLTFVFLEDL